MADPGPHPAGKSPPLLLFLNDAETVQEGRYERKKVLISKDEAWKGIRLELSEAYLEKYVNVGHYTFEPAVYYDFDVYVSAFHKAMNGQYLP